MAKVINITDKLSSIKPVIVVGEKSYPVEDGMDTVMAFEELAVKSTRDALIEAIELTLGKEAVAELNIAKWSFGNFKVITTAILASVQGISYEEAEARFPQG